jgi:Caspase recruitment domain
MMLILQHDSSAMDARHRQKLIDLRLKLVEDIVALELTDYLLNARILTDEDVEIIKSKTTTKDKARTLIDILPTRGPKAFGAFVSALKTHETNYEHLVTLLQEGEQI